MTMDILAMLAALTACAFLAWRSYRSHGKSGRETAVMAAAWVGIFIMLALLLNALGTGG